MLKLHRMKLLVWSAAFVGVSTVVYSMSKPSETTIVSGPLKFESRVIHNEYSYAYGISASDIDLDGDLDLTSADAVDNQLHWFANDGSGNLTHHLVYDNDPGFLERHAVGDLNGDKWPDIVIVKNRVGELLWFENSGKPADDKPWKRHLLTNDLPRAYDVALADIDADGDLDVAGSCYQGGQFAWFVNNGTPGDDKLWVKHLVDQEIDDTRTIAVADFNSDGRVDLLGTGLIEPLVAWYEAGNPQGTGPWKKHVVDEKSPNPCHGHPADMDGDGDIDIILALGYYNQEFEESTNQAAWYENVGQPGTGGSWKKHFIGELRWAFEAIAVDLDGDSDLDVAGTCMGNPGGVCWFENPGDADGTWQKHPLLPEWENANQVIAVDIDADGRLDLAGVAERGSNEFRLWRNLGRVEK
ncbi:MAG: FG-GAP repeat domain-containing protein [Planctomycetaceae bacterium]